MNKAVLLSNIVAGSESLVFVPLTEIPFTCKIQVSLQEARMRREEKDRELEETIQTEKREGVEGGGPQKEQTV